jgi:outer membrane biosynthesis protein TonB
MTASSINNSAELLTDSRKQLSLASTRDQSQTTKSFDLEIIMSTRSSKDRASLCLFAFKDGRRCRMPRAVDPYLCNFLARREAEQAARQRIGRNISDAFSGDYISASGLSLALARTLAATAQGQLKPKQAALIAFLGRTLLQAIPHARHEYIQAFGPDAWREVIRTCFDPPVESPPPTPPPAANPTPPNPAPQPSSAAKSAEETHDVANSKPKPQPPTSPSVPSPLPRQPDRLRRPASVQPEALNAPSKRPHRPASAKESAAVTFAK